MNMLENLCGVPVAGVVPYIHVDIDDEDSLSQRLEKKGSRSLIDIAVIRLPHISNFTDFSPLERVEEVSVRYVDRVNDLGKPDFLILPGTKSTIADLLWLRQNGLEAAIQKAAAAGTLIFGICGGYQMLGRRIKDPDGVESAAMAELNGLGLLDIETVFSKEKVQAQTAGTLSCITGSLSALNGLTYQGYEIHMGRSNHPNLPLTGLDNVYGTYIHGFFDTPEITQAVLNELFREKGISAGSQDIPSLQQYREQQYDKLAQEVRKGMDMEYIYRVLNREV